MVLTFGCQTAESETLEVPVEIEVTRVVEVTVETKPDSETTVALPVVPFFTTDVHTYTSEATGRDYTVYVTLPLGYEMGIQCSM